MTTDNATDNTTNNINNNVDPHEIEKFSSLASRWWDPQSEFKPLHDLNPVRVAYIDSHVDLTGKTVLDLGCGGGILTESLAKRAKTVKGIDMAKASIDVATLHALSEQIENIDYEVIRAEDLAELEPQKYDVICAMEMLEHVPQPQSILNAIRKLLKPGGTVFLSTINRNPKSYLFAVIGAEYVLKLLPKGTHDYKKFIKPSELAKMSRVAKLQCIDTKGMNYHPLFKSFDLSDDVSVNYLMTCKG
ncbi:MAG: bifunctional 2-polyprenyl-6-hydroxyphenol methylase/3-demethylubiquinol 3-O-methyltransferase UbiG [Saccharospirillaceae bacterium]|nr:bifunctional 2-polyprenyl-6-hydroxyphenol methylase/3-demethylubiquinol 3-O-methyltransferase UbiG [Pseudomonadales bacterium]NRB80149.1 bifunctional 2-polyprenyl-6-hydroxyphenol methylase/3-demethylubiquinol 3-O-methyltransferase UbiG [Saccharospirillaceae bacterium]